MKNDEDLQEPSFESHRHTLDIKDGTSNCNYVFSNRDMSAYQQFGKRCISDQSTVQKPDKCFEMNNAVQEEDILSIMSSSENDLFNNSKKRQLFNCSKCPKVFSNSSAIAKHKLTHSDERRYVCETCNKAFKRQDHLNGHKHTHTTNKPHGCHLCARSFSDTRSLRRHYDSQHQDQLLRCKQQIDDSLSVDVFGILDETKCIKCEMCWKVFKNQSALNGHMRLHGGYGPSNNGITGPGQQRSTVPCDLVSSSSLRDTTTTTSSTSVHSKLHSLLTMTSSDTIIQQDSAAHKSNTNNVNIDELYQCLTPQPVSDHLDALCTIMQTSDSSSIDNTTKEHLNNPAHALKGSSSIADPFVQSNNNSNLCKSQMPNYSCSPDNRNLIFEHSNQYQFGAQSTFTTGERSCFDLHTTSSDANDNKRYNSLSSNNFQDIIMNFECLDPCINLEDDWCNEDTNIIAESFVKKEHMDTQTVNNAPCGPTSCINDSISDALYERSTVQELPVLVSQNKCKRRPAPIFIPPQASAHMSKLRSPCVWNTGDSKEINIPPYTPPPMLSPQRKGSGLFNSVCQWNIRTSGNSSATNCPLNTPLSGNMSTFTSISCCNDSVASISSQNNQQISSDVTYSAVNDRMRLMWHDLPVVPKNGEPEHFIYQDDCFDGQPQTIEDSDGLPTSATPQINIGPQYQTLLPQYHNDKHCANKDRRLWDELLWDPKQFKESVESLSSLDLLMKIASSPAVKSCGLNMEYTFHLLCKFKGDLEKTLQVLLEDSFVVYDYVYAETTNWTTKEIHKFQERLKEHDRDFMRVAMDLQSCGMDKSVKACVEFYYVWKQMNNVKDINRYRLKSCRRKQTAATQNSSICLENHCTLPSDPSTLDGGYNLRNKFPTGNQKLCAPYSQYDYKTSGDISSRQQSPSQSKAAKQKFASNSERIKKPRPYHCSLCKRKFVKLKTLENHFQSHCNSNSI